MIELLIGFGFGLILIIQIVAIFIWLKGNLNLSNFFSNKLKSLMFFIPILGIFALLAGAIKARLEEDF